MTALVGALLLAAGGSVSDEIDFTLTLYQALAARPGNLIVSPANIRACLATAELGARGETAAQMATALGFSNDPDAVAAAAQADLDGFRVAKGKAELEQANRLWPRKDAALDVAFVRRAKHAFGASPEPLDFKGAPEASRTAIDRWVSEQTNRMVPELLPAGAITGSESLVLTSAVHFRGRWATAFDPKQTATGFFYAPTGQREVQMMERRGEYAYAKLPGATAVQLPYADSQLATLIVVPDAKDGLRDVEQALPALLGQLALGVQGLDLRLPRFTLSSQPRLVPVLEALGLRDAFDSHADFSGIGAGCGCQIGAVEHEASISVDETGTEAAAATAVVMKHKVMVRIEELVVDHPFLFLVRDRRNGRILFIGRLEDPGA